MTQTLESFAAAMRSMPQWKDVQVYHGADEWASFIEARDAQDGSVWRYTYLSGWREMSKRNVWAK